MTNLHQRPNPYDFLPRVPEFELRSEDLTDGAAMPLPNTAAGGNVSPQLSWSGFPEQTRSFAVTCFDPDAPTPAGWWHWTVVDLGADTVSLERGAGQSDLTLEGAAFHLTNDGGEHSYAGAAPPRGPVHRYIFVVHALDIETLDVDDATTPTAASFKMLRHTLARAHLTVTFQR